MKKNTNQKAIIVYGPPGSGKGTQAELLERGFDFIHFDTGRYLEMLYKSSKAKKDKILKKEKKLFDEGFLNTPSFVLDIVGRATKKIAHSGFSIVYSGSPRTFYEAFGDKKKQGLIHILVKEFGKKNIHVVWLKIKKETSSKRNSKRLICSICGLPIMASHYKIKKCAFCGGGFRTRTLDNPKIIKIRLEEYKNSTYPIIKKMKQLKFSIVEVNGEHPPYKVSQEIIKKLKLL